MHSSKLVVLAMLVSVAGCASMQQNRNQVYKRDSGDTLKYWTSAREGAALHGPSAWASVAAYQDEHDQPYRKPLKPTAQCPEPHAYLQDRKWELWEELPLLRHPAAPAGTLAAKMRDKHLRVEVWSNKQANKVIVAFGGTALSNLEDWKGNLRWVLRPLGTVDAYNVLTDDFVPAFVAAYKNRSAKEGNEWLKNAELVATGHSLGGGLAQQFAYALRPGPGVPRVFTVHAFDPSPVSGKRDLPGYEETAKGLTIYRIYNRGESLAAVRSVLSWGNPGNERNQGQTWIDVRYLGDWSWRTLLPSGTVEAHGMYKLACFMEEQLAAPVAPTQVARP